MVGELGAASPERRFQKACNSNYLRRTVESLNVERHRENAGGWGHQTGGFWSG